jgi:tripeptide aminopeptidase
MINRERLVGEFLELVKVDSVSGFEREIADILKVKLENLGFEVFEDDAGKKINTQAGNLIARLPANGGGGRPLMLCAHMDTVEPGRGVRPVVEDGTIKSSGDTVLGGDDKAGIAIILEALRVIGERGIKHGGLEVVLTVFEEGGLMGAANFDPASIVSRMGFVLDSDGPPGTIVNRAPTQDRISITVKGKSAHAGICPEKGISAIEVAARAITEMKLGRIDGETTANIGVISGGKATNIVPDTVFIQGETRSLDGAKLKRQTEEIVAKAREAAALYGAQVDIKVENLYRAFSIKEDASVIKIALEAAARAGLATRVESTGGGSDANMFNEKGISTVVLGIGMQNVHTTGEFITIDNLVKGSSYIVEIIKTAQEN